MIVEQRSYKGWDIFFFKGWEGFVDSWCGSSPDFVIDADLERFFIVSGQQIFAPTYDALITEIDNAEFEGEIFNSSSSSR